MIDARSRARLARLQVILWTLIVISAFLAGALANVRANSADPGSIADPLSIGVAEKLRILKVLNSQDEDVEKIDNVGRVMIRECPIKANVLALFKGDEVSNAAQLALGKVQIFYFTLILVFAYGVQLGSLFLEGSGVIENLPVLSAGILVLLALRHAGCLTNKAVTH